MVKYSAPSTNEVKSAKVRGLARRGKGLVRREGRGSLKQRQHGQIQPAKPSYHVGVAAEAGGSWCSAGRQGHRSAAFQRGPLAPSVAHQSYQCSFTQMSAQAGQHQSEQCVWRAAPAASSEQRLQGAAQLDHSSFWTACSCIGCITSIRIRSKLTRSVPWRVLAPISLHRPRAATCVFTSRTPGKPPLPCARWT